MKVSELGERRLLGAIRARLDRIAGPSSADLVIGIGDDAAVIAAVRNAHSVLTTDTLVEGVHFDRRFSTPEDIGYRALAVNLSDLAAMGAMPRWALVSLMLPDAMDVADVERLVDGVAQLAASHGTVVIGGNLARSRQLIVDVTAIGEVRPRRLLTRSGGRAGDDVYVSGTVGAAAAGLEMLREAAAPANTGGQCIRRYLRPAPRVRLGIAIAQARAARAAIDLSDGLADGLHQLADASECGIEVDADSLAIDPEAREWWRGKGRDPVDAALGGGDDYELLVASPASWAGRRHHVRARVADPPLTRIGKLTADRTARVLVRNGRREQLPEGFEHW